MKQFRIIHITAFHCTLELEIFVFLIAFFRVKTFGNYLGFRHRRDWVYSSDVDLQKMNVV